MQVGSCFRQIHLARLIQVTGALDKPRRIRFKAKLVWASLLILCHGDYDFLRHAEIRYADQSKESEYLIQHSD